MKPAIKPASEKTSRKKPRKNPRRPKRASTKTTMRSIQFTSRNHQGLRASLILRPHARTAPRSLAEIIQSCTDLKKRRPLGECQPRQCAIRSRCRSLTTQKRFRQLVDLLAVASAGNLWHHEF